MSNKLAFITGITGASNGIGLAMAKIFARNGTILLPWQEMRKS